MITYQRESFSSIVEEAQPLVKRHWQEIALFHDKLPLDVNYPLYFARERAGQLEIITARSNGALIGYIMQICGPGVHFQSVEFSLNDAIWLDPAYREGWVGIKLIIEMEKRLRERGVKVFEFQPKIHFERERGGLQKILAHRGFATIATVHQKWLGD